MNTDSQPTIAVGEKPLLVDEILLLAQGKAKVLLAPSPSLRARIRASNEILQKALRNQAVYGVTTGFGDSCENEIPSHLAQQLPLHLMRFHGCGTGQQLDELAAAAVVAVRVAALARGYSGVREVLLERLCAFLNLRLLPVIPEEGSVGASGDLTPLSYVAALLVGEREAIFKGQTMSAAEAHSQAGLTPLTLGPKESLAIMNGTSVMTALACIAFSRARRLARLSAIVTAMASDVLRGEPAHFDDRIFALKPYPGQRLCAQWIREFLEYDSTKKRNSHRIQDRYSIRCAPHIIGVLLDALPYFQKTLEIEINSINDNPIVDLETEDILHGGNFYGGHICYVMDSLKTAVANLADLADRQMALLCTPSMNNGLTANLVAPSAHQVTHHGFKAMQISASALTAEACKLTMPASVFSRSTECHNQDKVSMGTIAARDTLRILDLTETVVAITLLAACQAVDLRDPDKCCNASQIVHRAVRQKVPMNTSDRRQDLDIQAVLECFRSDQFLREIKAESNHQCVQVRD